MYTLAEWGPGPLDSECPNLGRVFHDEGYHTAYIGKWHLGDVDLERYGWQETRNVHETSNPPEGFETDHVTRDNAVDFLDSYESDDPFFLLVSFNLPHPPFIEDDDFAHLFDRDAIPLPESFEDDLEDKPSFQQERATGDEGNLSAEDVRDIRYKYRTMVARVDDHVGRILDAIERRNASEDTIIVFTSDHGDMQGAHRLNKKGVIAYDEIVRVPLIVSVPGRASERDQIPDLVSNRAIPETLVDAVNLDVQSPFEGESLLTSFDRESQSENDRVFFEHKYAYWGEHPYRGIRTRRWKFVEYLRDDRNELYDMHDLGEHVGDVVDGLCFAAGVQPEVRVLPALSTDPFLLTIQRRREVHEFDPLSDVDERGLHSVAFDRLDRTVGPRLEIRPDVYERVRVDDVARDRGIGLPAVAVESDRNEVLDGHGRFAGNFSGEVVERKERCNDVGTRLLAAGLLAGVGLPRTPGEADDASSTGRSQQITARIPPESRRI
jgi:choline-sulfatase